MSNWKIPLPKEKPEEGSANAAFSFMVAKGGRVEFHGKVTAEAAASAMRLLIQSQVKKPKEAA